jgi:hypothetical protein
MCHSLLPRHRNPWGFHEKPLDDAMHRNRNGVKENSRATGDPGSPAVCRYELYFSHFDDELIVVTLLLHAE